MEKIIKEMVTMKSSSANMARLSVAAVAVSGLVALGCMVFALRFIGSEMSNIYVLDRGNAMSATMASDDSFQRSLEVEDHVTRFHELMLNLSPSSEAIKSNIDRALLMSDRSAYNYWSDLSEQGFYQRLVSANISQQFALDSVKVDMKTYPGEQHHRIRHGYLLPSGGCGTLEGQPARADAGAVPRRVQREARHEEEELGHGIAEGTGRDGARPLQEGRTGLAPPPPCRPWLHSGGGL